MKRILFITHTISAGGGAERVLNTLIQELSSEYEIDVLEWLEDSVCPFCITSKNVNSLGSIAYSDRKASELSKKIIINRIKHFFLALINIFFPKILYKKYIKRNYDYEVSFNYLYTSALVAASENENSKKIMWIHSSIDDLNEEENFRGLKYKLYRWMQRKAFKKADAIITISQRTHKSVSMFYPKVNNRIIDIYNGYDFNSIKIQSKLFQVEQKQKFRLITMGRLSQVKNVVLQTKALKYLQEENIQVELLILGEGEQENEIRSYSIENKNIKLYGYQPNPYPFLLSADALIITSYAEGFPTIAVEAMALGKPVISTPVAGTEELITKETGIIVNWDEKSVADGIKQLLHKKFNSQKIKDHVSRYTKEYWVSNIKELFYRIDKEDVKNI